MVHRCMQESYAAEVHIPTGCATLYFEESKDCVAGSDVRCVRFVSGVEDLRIILEITVVVSKRLVLWLVVELQDED